MKALTILAAALSLSLAACSTYTPQRYASSADNNLALKALGPARINVAQFTGPAQFSGNCRAAGPIAPPDQLTFEGYIRKALIEELKMAGLFDEKTPDVTLSGKVDQLSFSSSRGLTGGSWDISLTAVSTNGRSASVKEHYEFNSGFVADTACKQTAEAYFPAVQNLIGKLVSAPEFKALIQR